MFYEFLELFTIELGKAPRDLLHKYFPANIPDYDLARHQAIRTEDPGQDQGKTGKYARSTASAIQQDISPPFGLGKPDG